MSRAPARLDDMVSMPFLPSPAAPMSATPPASKPCKPQTPGLQTPKTRTPLRGLAFETPIFDTATLRRTAGGWLIRRVRPTADGDPVYLQIAGGLWCFEQRATRFPGRQSALSYARRFGITIGRDAELVRPAEEPRLQTAS